MKAKIFVATSVCASLLLNTAYALDTITPVPGSDSIMQTFNLLDPQRKGYQIIKLNYKYGEVTIDQRYNIPDEIQYGPNTMCYQQVATSVSTTYEQYKESISSQYGIGGEFKKFSFSYSKSSSQAKEAIDKYEESVEYNEAVCYNYNLQFYKGKLSERFVDIVLDLPNEFNNSTKEEFFEFFDVNGDHVFTKCNMGGLLTQHGTTSKQYRESKGIKTVKEQASIKFYISVDGSRSKELEQDSQFTRESTFSQIYNTGGDYPQQQNNWAPWMQSVQQHHNLACIHWDAKPIYKFFDLDPRIKDKQAVVEQAMQAYFHRPGCTDSKSPYYDPKALVDDGSCLLIVPNCTSIIQQGPFEPKTDKKILAFLGKSNSCNPNFEGESFYLVEGPNNYGECAVDWVFANDKFGTKYSSQGGNAYSQDLSLQTYTSVNKCCNDPTPDCYGGEVYWGDRRLFVFRSDKLDIFHSVTTLPNPSEKLKLGLQLTTRRCCDTTGMAILYQPRVIKYKSMARNQNMTYMIEAEHMINNLEEHFLID